MNLHRLIVAVTASVLALAPPTYAGLEVSEEAGGLHCTPATPACQDVHVVNTAPVTIDIHVFGFEFRDSTCAVEFDLTLDEDADGYLENQALTGSQCSREPCTNAPWPVHGQETAPATEGLSMSLCIQPIGGGDQIRCTLALDLTDQGNHTYALAANDSPCTRTGDSPAETTGTWTTESTNSGIEINHM